MNGSSATGHCSSVSTDGGTSICKDPTSSVLFDGVIPTLTGLDGDTWASQLLTLETTGVTTEISFEFTETQELESVDVLLFNCPEWGVSVRSIQYVGSTSISGSRAFLGVIQVDTTSCDSIVRVSMPRSISLPVVTLEFVLSHGSDWIHVAEIEFYTPAIPTTTTAATIATAATTTSTATGTAAATTSTDSNDTTASTATNSNDTTATTASTPSCVNITTVAATCTCSSQPTPNLENGRSCSDSNTVTAIATAIVTGIMVTGFMLLIQIVICKLHPQFKVSRTKRKISVQLQGRDMHMYEHGWM